MPRTHSRDSERQTEARAPGARRRDQPRRQGRQGRPALLVHGARRRRRRGPSRSGSATARPTRSRVAIRRPSRTRKKNLFRVPQVRPTIPHSRRPLRRRPRDAEAGRPRYRRDRRRRRARRARARRASATSWPSRSAPEPDQPRAGDRWRACKSLRRPEDVAKLRGKTVAEVLPPRARRVGRGFAAAARRRRRGDRARRPRSAPLCRPERPSTQLLPPPPRPSPRPSPADGES